MSRKLAIVVMCPSLVLATEVWAQPPADPPPSGVNAGPVQSAPQRTTPQPQQQQRPAALDAAFGTPPQYGAPADDTAYGGNTYDEPGFVRRGNARAADQSYGSTSTAVGPDGQSLAGYQIYDENLYTPNEGGYKDDTPDYHVVQPGDTLWDISGYYLADPYSWPRVWSWNEHVTNAHWIFPGDRIRLYDPRRGRKTRTDDKGLRFSETKKRKRDLKDSYLLNQIAYVDKEQFETSMKITGGAQAKVMMASLDTAYMDYDKGNPPIPGERLVIYAPTEEVKDIENKETIGYLVQLMGEAEIESVAREAAEGTIVNALNPVERGYRVGPLRRSFRRIERVEPTSSASGLIVKTLVSTGPIPIEIKKPRRSLDPQVLAGDNQFVVIDLGSSDGVKEGNVLDVVRKGDEYTKKRVFKIPYEDGWPRRVIGDLLVIDVQENSSLCAVLFSAKELERGDHVELRGPGFDGKERGDGDRSRMNAEGDANVDSGDGKAKGSAGFSLGGSK
jgi:hypothetical protein